MQTASASGVGPARRIPREHVDPERDERPDGFGEVGQVGARAAAGGEVQRRAAVSGPRRQVHQELRQDPNHLRAAIEAASCKGVLRAHVEIAGGRETPHCRDTALRRAMQEATSMKRLEALRVFVLLVKIRVPANDGVADQRQAEVECGSAFKDREVFVLDLLQIRWIEGLHISEPIISEN